MPEEAPPQHYLVITRIIKNGSKGYIELFSKIFDLINLSSYNWGRMKVCTKCKEALPLSEFRKQSSTKDGLKYYCKKCDNASAKSYYKKNKEKIVGKVKEWQNSNPEKVKGLQKILLWEE